LFISPWKKSTVKKSIETDKEKLFNLFYKKKTVFGYTGIKEQIRCDQIKKNIRVGENGGLNQSKHQNSTIR
jgi:hypothetical protein